MGAGLVTESSVEMMRLKPRCTLKLLFALVLVMSQTYLWFHHSHCSEGVSLYNQVQPKDGRFTVWPKFNNTFLRSSNWYKTNCFGDKFKDLDISILYNLVQTWKSSNEPHCQALYHKFRTIYNVRQRQGAVVIPETFEPKVRKWLGGNDELFKDVGHQTITMVYNELTDDQTIFNPIRAKRPVKLPDEPEKEYIEKQQLEAAKTCDFCKYKEFTAQDSFGRIENEYAFSASNTFKYDAFHALFVTREHHPLKWKMADVLAMFDVAKKWFEKVYSIDSSYTYPLLIWDLNSRSGASQLHPHLQGSMDTSRYYGTVENWRRAGQEYYDLIGGDVNYFTDQLEIHNALGLAVYYGTAAAYASITPKKDNEIVIVAPEANEDFYRMIYFVTRAYLDDMEKLTFSAGLAYPQMGNGDKLGDIPAYARLITRGAVAEVRSDITSLELFLASQVNRDPYVVISYIKKSVENRG